MGQLTIKGKPTDLKISGTLSVYQYEENGTHFFVSPELDLIGYDQSAKKAKHSFQLVLQEYFEYVMSKGTLLKDLKKLGWKEIKKSMVEAPPKDILLKKNEQFAELLNRESYSKFAQEVTF